MINVSEAAAHEIERIALEKGQDRAGLRLFVKGGGCAGMAYGMEFVEEPNDNDKVFNVGSVRIFVDPKSYLFLSGVTMDFKSSLIGRSFVFENPNAQNSCGCGISFGV